MKLENAHYIAFVAVALTFVQQAIADVTVYRHADREQWFEDAGTITTLDFTGFSNNETITDQYSDVGVTFEGTNFVSGPVPVNYQDSWGLRILFGNEIAFEEPVHSFAGEYLGLYQLELYLEDTLVFASNVFGEPGLDVKFGAVISEQPFDRVVVFDPSDELSVFDNFHFGPPANMPAPSAIAVIGVAAMFNGRRRR